MFVLNNNAAMDLKDVFGLFIILSFLIIGLYAQQSTDLPVDGSHTTISRDLQTQTTKLTSHSGTTVIETKSTTQRATAIPELESHSNLTINNNSVVKLTTTTTNGLETDLISTTESVAMETTTSKPENCMKSRKDDFVRCMEALGKNAMAFVTANNMSGFLDDMCDSNGSKPYMECLQRHFRACPAFLERPEVEVLQFGPYHIKDVTYFSNIDQMCSCLTGLVCIQEILKIKQVTNFSVEAETSPWKMPKYRLICDENVSRNIGCVRKNLRQCQSPLTKRYGDDFTNDDAEDIKRLYSFSKEHCKTVNEDDFLEKYKCIQEKSNSDDFRECITSTEYLNGERRVCQMRSCVEEHVEDECDDDTEQLIPLYVDAVNVYRQRSYRLLNNVCSSASNIGISIAVFIFSVWIVMTY